MARALPPGRLVLTALLLASAQNGTSANLVMNGGFEDSTSSNFPVEIQEGAFIWEVVFGNVDIFTSAWKPVSNGTYALDLNGSVQGGIQQNKCDRGGVVQPFVLGESESGWRLRQELHREFLRGSRGGGCDQIRPNTSMARALARCHHARQCNALRPGVSVDNDDLS